MVVALPDGGGGAPVAQQVAQTGLLQNAIGMVGNVANTLVKNCKSLAAMFTGHATLTWGAVLSAAAPIAAVAVGTWLAIKAFCGIKKAIQNHHQGKVGRSATIDPNAAPAETPVAMNTPAVQQEQFAGQTP